MVIAVIDKHCLGCCVMKENELFKIFNLFTGFVLVLFSINSRLSGIEYLIQVPNAIPTMENIKTNLQPHSGRIFFVIK